MSSLTNADWAVIVGYFVFITGVGFVVSRRVKDTDDYFLGSRGFGRVLMMAQSFGIGTHAEQPVSLAGAVSRSGFAAIWYQWKNMFATPFYWVMAPIFRRCRRTTTAQVMEDRYGAPMAGVYTVFALIYFVLNLGAMTKGAAKVIHVATGYDPDQIVYAMTVSFILYSFVGGLVASAWTNFFQCFLQFVLAFLLIPLGWGLVGGMGGMKQTIGKPEFFSLSTPGDITLFLIVMLTLNGLIGIMAQPHILASVGSGRTERACRVGMLYGNFMKRFCTIGWALVGLLVLALPLSDVQQRLLETDKENAFGLACQTLLLPGMFGLLIASILADNMGAQSAFMVDSGALFTRGFYDRFVAPGRSDRHYLWAGRVSGAAITGGAVAYAIWGVQSVLNAFLLTETLSTYLGISLLGGLIWHRANRWGAIASFLAALGVNFGMHVWRDTRLDNFDPYVFGLALGAGVIALVVVSLVTPREGEAAQDLFDRLDTPPGLENLAAAEARAEAASRGDQLLLPNLLRLGQAAQGRPFFQAYREDLKGFAIGWAIAIGMIGAAWLLLQMG
jgi:Na+/proline symporter